MWGNCVNDIYKSSVSVYVRSDLVAAPTGKTLKCVACAVVMAKVQQIYTAIDSPKQVSEYS